MPCLVIGGSERIPGPRNNRLMMVRYDRTQLLIGDTLSDEEVLPGFRLAVSDLFAA